MGAPEFPYPYRCPRPLGALRLRLAPMGARAAGDGVWWPYGRDLTREGPHLVDSFPSERVERLVYCAGDWEVVAEEVYTNRGRIKVGLLSPQHGRGLVLLRLPGSRVIRLRVAWVAPRTVWS